MDTWIRFPLRPVPIQCFDGREGGERLIIDQPGLDRVVRFNFSRCFESEYLILSYYSEMLVKRFKIGGNFIFNLEIQLRYSGQNISVVSELDFIVSSIISFVRLHTISLVN